MHAARGVPRTRTQRAETNNSRSNEASAGAGPSGCHAGSHPRQDRRDQRLRVSAASRAARPSPSARRGTRLTRPAAPPRRRAVPRPNRRQRAVPASSPRSASRPTPRVPLLRRPGALAAQLRHHRAVVGREQHQGLDRVQPGGEQGCHTCRSPRCSGSTVCACQRTVCGGSGPRQGGVRRCQGPARLAVRPARPRGPTLLPQRPRSQGSEPSRRRRAASAAASRTSRKRSGGATRHVSELHGRPAPEQSCRTAPSPARGEAGPSGAARRAK